MKINLPEVNLREVLRIDTAIQLRLAHYGNRVHQPLYSDLRLIWNRLIFRHLVASTLGEPRTQATNTAKVDAL